MRFKQCSYLLLSLFIALAHKAIACSRIDIGGGSWINDNIAGHDSSHGRGVKLMNYIERDLGISINKLPTAPFVRQLFQLKTGETDMLLGLYPNAQREKDYLLTKSYYSEPLYLVTHRDFDRKVTSLNDIQDLTAVVVRAASNGEMIDSFLQQANSVLVVTDFDQRIGMVVSKRADYFFSSKQVLNMPQYQHPMLKHSKNPVTTSDTVLAISRNSDCKHLLPLINKIIEENF